MTVIKTNSSKVLDQLKVSLLDVFTMRSYKDYRIFHSAQGEVLVIFLIAGLVTTAM